MILDDVRRYPLTLVVLSSTAEVGRVLEVLLRGHGGVSTVDGLLLLYDAVVSRR